MKKMTLKQAIKIIENHNKWRRDNNAPPKYQMVDVKELGVAKDYCKIHDMDKVSIKPKKN